MTRQKWSLTSVIPKDWVQEILSYSGFTYICSAPSSHTRSSLVCGIMNVLTPGGPAIKELDKPKQNCDHKSSIIYSHLLIRALMISTQNHQGEVCVISIQMSAALSLSPVFPFCLGFATVTGRNWSRAEIFKFTTTKSSRLRNYVDYSVVRLSQGCSHSHLYLRKTSCGQNVLVCILLLF